MTGYSSEESTILLHKFNNRDSLGIETIFKVLYPKLCYYATSIIQDDFTSKDIVQDTFVKLCSIDKQFDDFDKLSAYLYISVRNGCLNYIRHRKMNDYQFDNESLLSPDIMMDKIMESEVLSILMLAINSLPKECAKIMELVVKGISSVEIANELNLAHSSVRAQKARGIKLLKEKLPKNIYLFLIFFKVF